MDRHSFFTSIKSRLIFLYLIIFLISYIGLSIFLYNKLRDTVISSVDNHLYSEVQLLANLLNVKEGNEYLKFDLRKLGKAEVGKYAVSLSGHYYQIVSPEGIIIARSPSLLITDVSLPVMPESLNPSYTIIEGPDGSPLRLITQSFRLKTGTIIIQAGGTSRKSYRFLSTFRNTILLALPIVFAFSWIGITIITGWSFNNLDIFLRKIGEVTEKNLNERIEEGMIDKEFRPLASNFNIMMDRIGDAFSQRIKFLSNTSHELKTPITIIKSYCDITLRRQRTPSMYKDTLYRIAETVDKMNDTISKILRISRSEADLFLLRPLNIDLRKIITRVIKLYKPYASTLGIMITVKGGPLKILGDKEKLTETFTNLIDNAIKYNKLGGTIDIDIAAKNGEAIVTMTNTGTAIPHTEKENIFERFYRIETAASSVHGSGLGLSIAKSIIEAHGGRIEVKNTSEKENSFIVYLKNELPKMAKNERIGEKKTS